MLYKERTEPWALVMLELLNRRMLFCSDWSRKLTNRRKGFQAELSLDTHTVQLGPNLIVLHDIRLLTLDGSTDFQIDTLIITAHKIYIYEVKNYAGSYYYEKGRYYTGKQFEVLNLSFQIEKAATYLRQKLRKWGYKLEVETISVFFDPTFMLYQAPVSFYFLLPHQLENHFQTLEQNARPLSQHHDILARQLLQEHFEKKSEKDLPNYSYAQLQKGIACEQCGMLPMQPEKYSCVCLQCGHSEKTGLAIRRSTEEFRQLFPEQKITAHRIKDWCVTPSQQIVSRVLRQHYTLCGRTRGGHYE